MRDSQRSRVYAAERSLPAGFAIRERGWLKLARCQEYVNSITETKFWRSLRKRTRNRQWIWNKRVEVLDGRGSSSARAGGLQINLPRWARCRMVILHEPATWEA